MPNTIEENIERLKAVVPAIKNSIITKGGTVNSGDGLEEFADDVLSIKNELTDITITSNGEYYSGEETTLTTTTFPVTVLDAVGTPLKHVDVIGNANQSGNPTPDNPIMPQGTGDMTRNLADLYGVNKSALSLTFRTVDNMKIVIDGKKSSGSNVIPIKTPNIIVPAGKYTVKIKMVDGHIENMPASGYGVFFGINQDTYSQRTSPGALNIGDVGTRTFTLSEDTVISSFDITPGYAANADEPIFNNATFECWFYAGTGDEPYEPYGIKIPISNDRENLWDEDYTGINTNAIYRPLFVGDGVFTLSTNFKLNGNITDIFLLSGNVSSGISSSTNGAYEGKNITAQSVDGYITIAYRANARPSSGSLPYCKTMLNRGSTALPYEPYRHTTTNTYLGEVETVRYVKKLVLDGTEDFQSISSGNNKYFRLSVEDFGGIHIDTTYCTHFESVSITSSTTNVGVGVIHSSVLNKDALGIRPPQVSTTSLEDFTTYLTQQYNNGTPVTVWYVLSTPTTGIVNEQLMKIGEYADQLSIDTNIPLEQNAKNIINIDTTLKPSSASFTYNKKGNYIGYNKINVNVSNTYTAEDEGKVVNNAALVSQTAMPTEITVNNTYDTTLYNSIVVNVPPTPTPSVKSDVVFYDYDGTIVQSYSANDFANLSELPANPTHEGLTAQGWNWSLADAKTYVANSGPLNIGQMYTTSDGKTRLYISLPDGRTSPILQLYLYANTELDIDWGDGSTHSTWTTTIAGYNSERHNYPDKGKYVIAITVVSGSFKFQSSNNSYNSFFTDGKRSNSSSDMVYLNSIQKIEIGTGVTLIGDYAFMYCYSLSSVTIPDVVTTIGNQAFARCSSLSSVTIGDSVASIGSGAFQSCYTLSSVTIPNSVTTIGGIFNNCYTLSSVTIPDSVTTIQSNTFNNCYSLSSITISDSVTTIGSNAFQNCYSLSSVTIGDSVTSIGNQAFNNCYALSAVTIGDSVTTIGNQAFTSCSSLSSITIGDSVASIGSGAFQSCYTLSSVTIPDGVTSIGSSAFNNCYALSSITIPDSVTTIGNAAFASCSALSSITIPDGVTSIESSTFQYCYSLYSITIPDSVTTIQSNAFSYCSNMDYIKFLGTTPPTVSSSNAWTLLSKSTILYTPALVSNLYMDGTNYPAKATYTYIGYATYASGETLPSTTTDETYTLTWYATSADAIAQTNPITQGTGNEVYSRATPVV